MASFNSTGVSTNGASVVLGSSTVVGNGTGVSQTNGGTISSYKNNQINLNGVDGTPLPGLNAN